MRLFQTLSSRHPQFSKSSGRAWPLLLLLLLAAPSVHGQDTFADLSTRAAAARDSNDPKSAISLYQSALRLKPDWREGLWISGSLLYEAEQYREAAETLRRLSVLTPRIGPAWALLGLCEYETGDFNSAFEHIEKALSLGVGDQRQLLLVLKFHEAALLTKFGHFDSALEKYNGFLTGQVSDRQALLGLGLLSLHRPLAPSEVPDDHSEFYLSAGKAFSAFLANDQPTARQAYLTLVNQYLNDPDVHCAYGYFLLQSDPDLAIEQWRKALALDPSHASSHGLLAWTYSLRGESKLALDHARAASAKDPDLTVAQIVMGRTLVASGDIGAGVPHLEKAVLLQPGNLEAHLALATAYSEAGRKADAERERELCIKRQAENSVAAR